MVVTIDSFHFSLGKGYVYSFLSYLDQQVCGYTITMGYSELRQLSETSSTLALNLCSISIGCLQRPVLVAYGFAEVAGFLQLDN